ncbi:hypothetical protein GQ53DRAFT_876206 [Thozetella sp. PMI_491]|nr:hypothetical protein GQ53DRAFT_876206 [Thozetella sp. PMI_491]
MSFVSLIVLSLAPQLLVALPLEARQNLTCNFSPAANSGDTCSSFATEWGLTEASFETLNPGVSCPTLATGQSYCVIGTVSEVTTTSSASSSTEKAKMTTSTSSSTNIISTSTKTSITPVTTSTTSSSSPEPTRSALADNCNSFHLVVLGDQCSTIEAQHGIAATEFSSWNPFVDSSNYVCVGVTGYTATTIALTTTTTPTSSIPSPLMPSIVSSCQIYYQVESGDSCYSIEQAKSITLAEILAWNGYVDASCDSLWLGYYVCVSA